MALINWSCLDCDYEVSQDAGLLPPECCGSTMRQLPPCDGPHVAESYRQEYADEACDDGVH
ncbi:MAG: hypothetical protein A2087_00170 [Spirochaetes bacterium GWD1_61_31]|nr:MAG: hypothetical protein A2Y37_06845 [Spirochaetes bacterium GWB1_60_80]OHD30792.1 MAG: hypothetical protein A2004_04370 [Spirochaetes bacterium GWC1_61_12]OHD42962.1 MAG: hypothetical protein A2087_00170 [Spirochaetes bacterium GWD1_61_31]OHD46292.1 MAG: hypothetical protein A2Y35_07120 [Spirochaetes bacterium GWE1_60_18]OHD60899.1 MAG: hypothetical protein A2Y32_11865 [Spirochaetes bacterium GWF1_60_12]HAP42845.1 hypothetical protein [Spirochaetaceae bacterium]